MMSRKGVGRIGGRSVTNAIPQPAGGVRLETFVPWTLVKRGAKKLVVRSRGVPQAVQMEEVKPRDVGTATPQLQALGLAHYWQHLLDTGRFGSLIEIAAAEGMDLAQVS